MTDSPVQLARHILWHRWEEPGLEHLYFHADTHHVIADGMIVGMVDRHLLRLHYEVHADGAYRFQTVHLDLLEPFQRTLTLSRAANGTWSDDNGRTFPDLVGSHDIDLSVSPFTNTLPIRRLSLDHGQSAEIEVAFIELPAFTIRPERQRYTVLDSSNEYTTYHFEHLANGYSVDIRVDPDGLVIDYPGLFRRVHTQ